MSQVELLHDQLWVSTGPTISCYKIQSTGALPKASPIGPCLRSTSSQDICKFALSGDKVVAGDVEGKLHLWNSSQQLIDARSGSHVDEINAVDICRNIVVSGSRDNTAKVWRIDDTAQLQECSSQPCGGRVWSVALEPRSGEACLVGTSALNGACPLYLMNIERGFSSQLDRLNTGAPRDGAGVHDIHWETPHSALTTGYDTYIRWWDMRRPMEPCLKMWTHEALDVTMLSVRGDGGHCVVVGTALHALTLVFDRRWPSAAYRSYYAGMRSSLRTVRSSPVYSVAFSPRQLYVALDSQITGFSFDY